MSIGKGLPSLVKRWLGDAFGNVAILGAVLLPVGIAAAALAVDEGSLYLERREAQSVTDLAAIAGAANIDRAEAAVLATFGDNRHQNVVLVEEGTTPPMAPGAWGPTEGMAVTGWPQGPTALGSVGGIGPMLPAVPAW